MPRRAAVRRVAVHLLRDRAFDNVEHVVTAWSWPFTRGLDKANGFTDFPTVDASPWVFSDANLVSAHCVADRRNPNCSVRPSCAMAVMSTRKQSLSLIDKGVCGFNSNFGRASLNPSKPLSNELESVRRRQVRFCHRTCRIRGLSIRASRADRPPCQQST